MTNYPQGQTYGNSPVPYRAIITELSGKKYENAREKANTFNKETRLQESYYEDADVILHHYIPVKLGGAPASWKNINLVTKAEHVELHKWWNELIEDTIKKNFNK